MGRGSESYWRPCGEGCRLFSASSWGLWDARNSLGWPHLSWRTRASWAAGQLELSFWDHHQDFSLASEGPYDEHMSRGPKGAAGPPRGKTGPVQPRLPTPRPRLS